MVAPRHISHFHQYSALDLENRDDPFSLRPLKYAAEVPAVTADEWARVCDIFFRIFVSSFSSPFLLSFLSGCFRHRTLAPECSLRASTRRSTLQTLRCGCASKYARNMSPPHWMKIPPSSEQLQRSLMTTSCRHYPHGFARVPQLPPRNHAGKVRDEPQHTALVAAQHGKDTAMSGVGAPSAF